MQFSLVGHVGVLQDVLGVLVELWSVRANDQQCDGEAIELHVRILSQAGHDHGRAADLPSAQALEGNAHGLERVSLDLRAHRHLRG